MRIEIIASGSSGNAYVLHQEDGASLLVEAGIPYRHLQVALKHRVTELDGCLISHEHGDHATAAAHLAKAGVDLYASPGTFQALGLAGHRVHLIADQQPVSIGPRWIVLPFAAVHDATEPLGFVILAADGDRLLYLSDSAYCAHTFKDLTHVMVEANYSGELLRRQVVAGSIEPQVAARTIRNHMSLERCIDLLKANDLRAVREIHLLHLSNSNSDERGFQAAVERATGIPTRVAPEGVRA